MSATPHDALWKGPLRCPLDRAALTLSAIGFDSNSYFRITVSSAHFLELL